MKVKSINNEKILYGFQSLNLTLQGEEIRKQGLDPATRLYKYKEFQLLL